MCVEIASKVKYSIRTRAPRESKGKIVASFDSYFRDSVLYSASIILERNIKNASPFSHIRNMSR